MNFLILFFTFSPHFSSAILTNEEKKAIHYNSVLSMRILTGLFYPMEDFYFYLNNTDSRSFEERVQFYYVNRTAEEQNSTDPLRFITRIERYLQTWLSQNLEYKLESLIPSHSYNLFIMDKLRKKKLLRWPRITCDFENNRLVIMKEVYLDEHEVYQLENSEVNYDEDIEIDFFEFNRLSIVKFSSKKHMNLGFLEESVSQTIRNKVSDKILKRVGKPSAHHIISLDDLAIFGNHYNCLALKFSKNEFISGEKILENRAMENVKLMNRGANILRSDNYDFPFDSLQHQIMVKDIVQASGNLFFGPHPDLREDDHGSNFESGAKVFLSSEEYKMLKNLYDRLELTVFSNMLYHRNFNLKEKWHGKRKEKLEEKRKMSKGKRVSLNDNEKKQIVREIIDELSGNLGNNFMVRRIIELQWSSLFDSIGKTFFIISAQHGLNRNEPFSLNPIIWDVRTVNQTVGDRWRLLTKEELDGNIERKTLPKWLEEIIEEVEGEENVAIGLRFGEPNDDENRAEPKKLEDLKNWDYQILDDDKDRPVKCFGARGSTFTVTLAEVIDKVLLADFDTVQGEFFQMPSTFSAQPDIWEFLKKELLKGHGCNPKLKKIKDSVCNEMELGLSSNSSAGASRDRFWLTGNETYSHQKVSNSSAATSEDILWFTGTEDDSDNLSPAVLASLLSSCSLNNHRTSRSVSTKRTNEADADEKQLCGYLRDCYVPFMTCKSVDLSGDRCPKKTLIDQKLLYRRDDSRSGFEDHIYAVIQNEAKARSGLKLLEFDVKSYANDHVNDKTSVVYVVLSNICGLSTNWLEYSLENFDDGTTWRRNTSNVEVFLDLMKNFFFAKIDCRSR